MNILLNQLMMEKTGLSCPGPFASLDLTSSFILWMWPRPPLTCSRAQHRRSGIVEDAGSQ